MSNTLTISPLLFPFQNQPTWYFSTPKTSLSLSFGIYLKTIETDLCYIHTFTTNDDDLDGSAPRITSLALTPIHNHLGKLTLAGSAFKVHSPKALPTSVLKETLAIVRTIRRKASKF